MMIAAILDSHIHTPLEFIIHQCISSPGEIWLIRETRTIAQALQPTTFTLTAPFVVGPPLFCCKSVTSIYSKWISSWQSAWHALSAISMRSIESVTGCVHSFWTATTTTTTKHSLDDNDGDVVDSVGYGCAERRTIDCELYLHAQCNK